MFQSSNPNHTDPTFLIFENVTYEDAGKYACEVSNSFGVSWQKFWLDVLPRKLSFSFSIIQMFEKSITFLRSLYGVSCVKKYKIVY